MSASARHTQGPWRIHRRSGHVCVANGTAGGCRVIADPCGLVGYGNPDAHLIAAAPELLEALKDLTALYEASPGRDPAFVEKARTAIAKAEGR